jgi:hypothetical protein
MPKKTAKKTAFYQIKVTLKDSPLPIWRRLLVDPEVSLNLLHEVFQIAMGWWDCHLYEFRQGDLRYGALSDIDHDPNLKDLDEYTLSSLLKKPGDKLTYIYDFSDDWLHEIIFEQITSRPQDEQKVLAFCLNGKRACPVEDCGGVGGFADFLNAVEDPLHPEHHETLAWAGDGYDPNAFDSRAINLRLILWANEINHELEAAESLQSGASKRSAKKTENGKKSATDVDAEDNLIIFNRHKPKK